jgi:uncharacterized SAM-binding protein YcdF (DUF218 family)
MNEQGNQQDGVPAWRTSWWTLGTLACFVCLVVGTAALADGKVGLEKALTRLSLPAGLIWLVLAWLVIDTWMRRRRKVAGLLLIGWLAYTMISSPPCADALIGYLEMRYAPFQPGIDEDLDVLVVLGGGTLRGPNRAQAGTMGDRVLLAAELYLNGHARRLITTGDSMPAVGGRQRSGPKEETLDIWITLGVAEEDIAQVSGINTYAEIESLKAMSSEFSGKRVGLLTSAFHLPRAMRLAHAAGLTDFIPVPANFHPRGGGIAFVELLPRSEGIETFTNFQREIMAGWIGR